MITNNNFGSNNIWVFVKPRHFFPGIPINNPHKKFYLRFQP